MITFVNVFTVKSGQQQLAFQRIHQVYAEVVTHQPGFRQARLLMSDDGTTVTAVAEWETAEHLAALKQNPQFQALHDNAFYAAIETVAPRVYSTQIEVLAAQA